MGLAHELKQDVLSSYCKYTIILTSALLVITGGRSPSRREQLYHAVLPFEYRLCEDGI